MRMHQDGRRADHDDSLPDDDSLRAVHDGMGHCGRLADDVPWCHSLCREVDASWEK